MEKMPLDFQCVQLAEEPLDAVAHLLALGAEGVDLLLEALDGLVDSGLFAKPIGLFREFLDLLAQLLGLFSNLLFEGQRAQFGVGTGLALAANEVDGAEDALLEIGKVVGGEQGGFGRRSGYGGFGMAFRSGVGLGLGRSLGLDMDFGLMAHGGMVGEALQLGLGFGLRDVLGVKLFG
jgi:hypothetical protein